MNNSIKLSICMMVKDEEKNLQRCLDALKPLLEKPDIELIIVDTGSKDNTVEIASRYTARVYFHEWKNNFSGMRNITISYAKGYRIFILDADEVLLDADKLYEIVSDKNLMHANTLVLKIKNLSDVQGVYTILPQERIFRNDGEFRYDGSVHNQPIYKAPVLKTDICLEHYGYMFKDPELKERKFKRTGTILKKELEKNPTSIYYRYQLAKSYDAHGDYREALEEIRKVYKLIENEKKRRFFVFGSYAMICMRNNEYEEAVAVCREGLDIETDYLDLYYFMAESQKNLGRRQEAFASYQTYLEYLEKYDQLPIAANRAVEMFSINDTFCDVALINIISELFKQNRYGDARVYIQKLHDEKKKSDYLFLLHLKLKEFNELKALYVNNLNDRNTINKFETTIEDEKGNFNAESKKEIERIFCSDEDTYSLLNKIRISEEDNKEPLISKVLTQANLNELPDFYADMFLSLDKKPQQLFSHLKHLQKRKIRGYTKRLIDTKSELKAVFETYLLQSDIRESDINGLRLYIGIAYVMLYEAASTVDKVLRNIPEPYPAIFNKYLEYGAKYSFALYKTERLRLYYDILEDMEDRFFIAMAYARESVDRSDYKSAIRYFKEALNFNQYMACYMEQYREDLFKGFDTADLGRETDE